MRVVTAHIGFEREVKQTSQSSDHGGPGDAEHGNIDFPDRRHMMRSQQPDHHHRRGNEAGEARGSPFVAAFEAAISANHGDAGGKNAQEQDDQRPSCVALIG